MDEVAPKPVREPLIAHGDGHARCFWCGTDPFYMAYHDTEWGVPERDSRALFEKLLLDGFQAGLSWITILRKRENFRRAFDGFEPEVMARYDAAKVEALMQDAGIVRNRAKVEGAVLSARAYLELRDKGIAFTDFMWDAVDGETKVNRPRRIADIPAETAESKALSKRLKAAGFKFVGPTIVYAAMQACGLVDDHLEGCHCAKG
ncbi:DNA-3-methyladenine glycosylase I [Xanthobacter autotrophicus DSM 597]|uniref:DNA-3-methyladenine glycosylase I n=1 Tax=Xanthobacter TaxID=279 RepID=UPI001AE9EB0A|nr:DNA-3-methyladenine glycosylase I [Xanthobacter flavus]MBP2150640.1 DNA-3-methyladenine glycosylase I [Xanthobacter flavus]